MPIPDDLLAIIDRLQKSEQTEQDVSILQKVLSQLNTSDNPISPNQAIQQHGKYNFSSETASQIKHFGDQIGWKSEEVTSFVIRLFQALAPANVGERALDNVPLDDSWENLKLDVESLSQLAEQINSRLTSLQNIHRTVELPEEQRLEFNNLKSSLYSLRDIDRQLEDLSRRSKSLLQQAIEELTLKLHEFDALQQNHLVSVRKRACTAEHLAALTQFQAELRQGQKLAKWINQRQAVLSQQIGQHALDAYPNIRDAASEKQKKLYFLSIKQYLARICRCLQSGKYDYLDMPSTPVILDEKLYIKAFNFLQELIPNHVTVAGAEQLKEYVEYMVDNLSKYRHL